MVISIQLNHILTVNNNINEVELMIYIDFKYYEI